MSITLEEKKMLKLELANTIIGIKKAIITVTSKMDTIKDEQNKLNANQEKGIEYLFDNAEWLKYHHELVELTETLSIKESEVKTLAKEVDCLVYTEKLDYLMRIVNSFNSMMSELYKVRRGPITFEPLYRDQWHTINKLYLELKMEGIENFVKDDEYFKELIIQMIGVSNTLAHIRKDYKPIIDRFENDAY